MNRTEFYSFYRKEILPLLGKYENERKKIVNIRFCLIFSFGILLLICLFAIFLFLDAPLWGRLLASIVICAISYLKLMELEIVFKRNIVAKFLIKIKNETLNNILSKIGDLKWSIVANSIYKESICGTHNGINFEIIEDLESLTFEFATNKLFKAKTFVHSKYDTNIIVFVLSFMFLITLPICFLYLHVTGVSVLKGDDFFEAIFFIIVGLFMAVCFVIGNLKYRKTKLEDISFNKNYVVRCEDEVEARYFLTTGFMERFKNLKTVFGKKNINCKCENNKITFTIDKKGNPFEIISVFKSFDNPEVMIKLYLEINAIFKMIDYFKLAEDTKI